jgi:hypothetical protein
MLCIAGMACSGDGPPLGAVGKVPGGDLEFVFPAVRGETPIFASAKAANAVGSVDADTALGTFVDVYADVTEGSSKESAYTGPLIFSTNISTQFTGSRFEMEYGMTGFGTGYSMKPSLDIVTSSGDRIIASAGYGRSEDAPIPWRFKPVVNDYVLLHRDCGMLANLAMLFEARLLTKVTTPTVEQTPQRSTAHAPLCPVVTTESGGGDGGGTLYTVTICSYDAWYDSWGNLIDVFFLGCVSYQIGNMY